jgi:hypothetical protein
VIAMSKNDDVTRNPALEELIAEVDRLAELDAKTGAYRTLTGALATLQDHYDDIYQQELIALNDTSN